MCLPGLHLYFDLQVNANVIAVRDSYSLVNKSLCVLHVEDEDDFADLVATFLTQQNDHFDLYHADCPEKGIDILEERTIDCIVSDYDMPGGNGIAFLQSVRETYPDLPFILYTGKGSEEIASEAISAGVSDYLQKAGGSSQLTILANRINNLVEQYHAKQTAVENQKRLSLFFDQSPLGVVEWNEQFEFVRLNEQAEDILGYDQASLVGKSWEVIVPEEDTPPVGTVVEELLEGDGGYLSVNKNVRNDGRIIHCEWHNRVIEDGGNTVGIISKFRDITQRVERERELELKNRAMNEAPVGITITDPNQDDNPLIYVNEEFERLTGFQSSDILGQNCRFLQGESTAAVSKRTIREAIDGGESITEELINYRRDGSEFWNRVSIAPVRNETNEIVNYVGFQQDVSAHKVQELELETVIDNLPGYIYRHKHEPEYPLIYVKGDAASITGYTAEELTNEIEMAEQLIHPKDRDKVWDEHVDRIDSIGHFDAQYRIITKDGEIRWIRDQGQLVIDPVSGETFLDGFVTDITELHEREKRLERFASIVSHDLRNPLTIADGRVALAQKERESEHLTAAREAHSRMEALIDNLLSLAKEGEQPGGVKPTDMPSVVDQSWSNVETKHATLRLQNNQSLLCDANRLKQLLENLFRNAIEHGGEAVTVTIGELPTGFYVEDDGEGIDESIQDDIFEPGFSTKESGTGFGLSIVGEIVEEHTWAIEVSDATSGGARFEISNVSFEE